MFTNFTYVLMLVSHFLVTLLLWANVFYGDQAHVGIWISLAAFSTVAGILAFVALVRQERKTHVGLPS